MMHELQLVITTLVETESLWLGLNVMGVTRQTAIAADDMSIETQIVPKITDSARTRIGIPSPNRFLTGGFGN